MGNRFSGSIVTVPFPPPPSPPFRCPSTPTAAQTPQASGAALKTPWGEPDLQGIWTEEFDTPLQRPAKYGNQEFFTDAERADLDKARTAVLNRFATEREINGAYNAATFFTTKRTGARTSKIVDPPNGRIPALTPDAQKTAAAERSFRLALLQSTDTCKKNLPGCAGGKFDPTTSPRYTEPAPRYNTARMNRNDGSGGELVAGALPHGWTARVRRRHRQLPPHRADARRHLDVLRRRPGPRLAAQHRHGRQPSPAGRASASGSATRAAIGRVTRSSST